MPPLWDPRRIVAWNVPFLPLFGFGPAYGAVLLALNWWRLGERRKAAFAAAWVFSAPLVALAFLTGLSTSDAAVRATVGDHQAETFYTVMLVGAIATHFAAWYRFAARPQIAWLREADYPRRGWLEPNLAALVVGGTSTWAGVFALQFFAGLGAAAAFR